MPALVVPRSFFVKERNDLYEDWRVAFFREICQNSIDGGARRIAIRLTTLEDGTCRVIVTDDGRGMDQKTVEDVFFRLGATTKDQPNADGSQAMGGFGRARIIICFAQKSYRIVTQDVVVDGSGAEYSIRRNPTPQKGCQFQIDIDGADESDMTWGLRRYLSECQLPVQTAICGNLIHDTERDPPVAPNQWLGWRHWARRGRVTHQLEAKGEAFATVHVNGSEYAAHKGRVIVRVNGTSMFTNWTSLPEQQVIVEIDPTKAHPSYGILSASRDSLRGDYRHALNRLLEDIAVDSLSALKDRSRREEIRFTSQDGKAAGFSTRKRALRGTDVPLAEAPETNGDDDSALTQIASAQADADPPAAITPHVDEYADPTSALIADVGDGDNSRLAAEIGEDQKPVRRLPAVIDHDVFTIIDAPNPAVTKVLAQYDPTRWRPEGGEGATAQKLMAMWKAGCEVMVQAACDHLGVDRHDWGIGFYFGPSAAAEYRKRDGLHVYHLNPVDGDGRCRFKLSDKKSWRRLVADARHEVAHGFCETNGHNEVFANLLSELDAMVADKDIFPALQAALNAVNTRMGLAQDIIAEQSNPFTNNNAA